MTCEHCGTVQTKPPHYSERQWRARRFCSKRCRGVVMKPRALVHRVPHTSATKARLRLLRSLQPDPRLGRHSTEETKAKLREAFRGSRSSLWIDGRSGDAEYQRFRGRHKAYRRRAAVGSHTKEQWDDVRALYGFACACCRRPESEARLTEDHIVPVFRGGTNWIWNIQPLCQSCNARKHIRTIHYEVPA